MATADLTGVWDSYYRYPSSERNKDDFWGAHQLLATQEGNIVKLKSTQDSPSQLTIELKLDGSHATGTWREHTDPDGFYKGEVYDGTIELKVSEHGDRLSGMWHGKGQRGEMNSDVWELSKASMQHDKPFSGKWYSLYRYLNIGENNDAYWERYVLKATQQGNKLVFTSGTDRASLLTLELVIDSDGQTAKGVWRELTNPTGPYRGDTYVGTAEMKISDDNSRFSGTWYRESAPDEAHASGAWELFRESEEG